MSDETRKLSDFIQFDSENDDSQVFFTFGYWLKRDGGIIYNFFYDDANEDSSPFFYAEQYIANEIAHTRLSEKILIGDNVDGQGYGLSFIKTEGFDITMSKSVSIEEFFSSLSTLHKKLKGFSTIFMHRNQEYRVEFRGIYLTPVNCRSSDPCELPEDENRIREDGVHF
jgi:hypothetical protein